MILKPAITALISAILLSISNQSAVAAKAFLKTPANGNGKTDRIAQPIRRCAREKSGAQLSILMVRVFAALTDRSCGTNNLVKPVKF